MCQSRGPKRSLCQPKDTWYSRSKTTIDFVISIVFLFLLAPFMILAALAIKLTSRGPIFYCQTRVGKNGRLFTIIKLRTMRHNCEAKSGAQWSTPGDCRITLVGRILRHTHIDEFPQLLNVLRGEMSLVGPRPERPEFTPSLEKAIPYYHDRLLVKPGITGLAQIQLPPDTDIESVRKKLAYDICYINKLSPWLDLRILLSTGFKFLCIPFAYTQWLLRLPNGINPVQATDYQRTPNPELISVG